MPDFVLASRDRFLISVLMLSIFPLNAENLVLCCYLHLQWAVADRRFQAQIVITIFFPLSSFEYTHCCVLQLVPLLFQSQQHSKAFTTVLLLPARQTRAIGALCVCEASIIVGLETISIHLADFDLRKLKSIALLNVFSFCMCAVQFCHGPQMWSFSPDFSLSCSHLDENIFCLL